MARAKKTKAAVPTETETPEAAEPNDRTTSEVIVPVASTEAEAEVFGPALPTEAELGEAAMEHAWKVSGDLHVIANRLGLGLLRGEIPPALAWVHKALLNLANASVNTRSHAKAARSLVRYVAVREAQYREGYTWDDAPARAAAMLHGHPAAASPSWMAKEYKKVRKALRDAGAVHDDNDDGYRWLPSNDPPPD